MKKITAFTFAIMLAAALAACGSATTETPTDSPQGNEQAAAPTPPPSMPSEDDDFFALIVPEVEVSPFDSLEVAPESDFSYKFDSATGGMMITKYNGSMTGLRIPETIEGEPVTAIGEEAFGNSAIEVVDIPDSVVAIGEKAFRGCGALTDISLPSGLTAIEAGTFRGCGALTDISLPSGLTAIEAEAFFSCSSLTEITLPDSVATIDGAIFSTDIAVTYKGLVYNGNEVVTAAVLSGYGYEPMEYGGHNWFVLDRAEGKALLLSAGIIEDRAYHADYGEITWEGSTIRQWLNEDFYYSIGKEERERIAETSIVNNDNPWFGTEGGNDTTDKIFLLSIEEVVQYFGDSGQLANRPVDKWGWGSDYIDDEYNAARIAYETGGGASWWWLRSPGGRSFYAASVGRGGDFRVIGDGVGGVGGIRPALWLNL
ncbi:MAG: leucine-rich repeat domain-containing protein [Lachnospiraceae bacterium]|nr:leucine-rich repeat domain-containing protein [Lachnospiraceae bacterium]